MKKSSFIIVRMEKIYSGLSPLFGHLGKVYNFFFWWLPYNIFALFSSFMRIFYSCSKICRIFCFKHDINPRQLETYVCRIRCIQDGVQFCLLVIFCHSHMRPSVRLGINECLLHRLNVSHV